MASHIQEEIVQPHQGRSVKHPQLQVLHQLLQDFQVGHPLRYNQIQILKQNW